MLINDLIKKLEEVRDKHGNAPVVMYDATKDHISVPYRITYTPTYGVVLRGQ